MTDTQQMIGVRLRKIREQCEEAYSVLHGEDFIAKGEMYRNEHNRFQDFLNRICEERIHGKNEALRRLARIEMDYFEDMQFTSVTYLTPFLKDEVMSEQDAEEEASELRLEYILDTIEQLLRSLLLEYFQVKT